ncbi:MAG: crossover junction endodeoxyribonuclease RuvC [Nitrospinae bacterium]|nr:crossover junction endodeoxyribonuclease RuvC [Nitrospinota bacterium]
MNCVIGIDPGSNITGYAVVEEVNNKYHVLTWGIVDCRKLNSISEKLTKIFKTLSSIIDEFSPRSLAIENIFVSKNVKSALKLGHARGTAIVAAGNKGVAVYEYTPLEIKKSVAGYGQADKEQINFMVKKLCNIREEIKPVDASDAIAVAVCHLNSNSLQQLIAAQK